MISLTVRRVFAGLLPEKFEFDAFVFEPLVLVLFTIVCKYRIVIVIVIVLAVFLGKALG